MSKNYFIPKTGHIASDVYFKYYAAIWHDSDMLKSFVTGTLFGILIAIITKLIF